jgi:hypothetical protein
MWQKCVTNKHLLFVLGTLVYFSFALTTYKDYGITSDEQLEYRAGKVYLRYLASSPEDRRKLVAQVAPQENPQSFPYFRLYAGIVSAINFGSYYEWAHLLNLCFGYVGLLTSYLLVSYLTGSKLAVLAPVLLGLNPYYFGHIPANPKDIPFATLYLVGVYLLIKLTPTKLVSAIPLGITLGLLVGLRFVGGTLVCLLVLKLTRAATNCQGLVSAAKYFAVTLLTASVVLYSLWPYLWVSPGAKLLALIQSSQAFAWWDRTILFNGQLITKATRPWYYLFTYLVYKTPPVVLMGALGACCIRTQHVRVMMAVVLGNLALYVAFQPTIYNELRHFLYLVPLITVAAACTVIKLLTSRRVVLARITFLVVLYTILSTASDFAALHPYQYVYFNALAGPLARVTTNYEVDYWSASYKEATEYVRALARSSPIPLKVYPCNLAFGVDYYSHKAFRLVNKSSQADYIICDYQNALLNKFALAESIVYTVTRKGATLSYVAKTTR